MPLGAVYWNGIARLVFALSERRLLTMTLSLPCREVFARGQRTIEVIGPLLEDEASAVHAGFWR
jgi:tRNA(Arg) A34 adenosine deaminase TadA